MKYIIIGFGGTGSDTVNEFLEKVPKKLKRNFAPFAIDTEKDKLVKMTNIPEKNKIQISEKKLVKDMIANYPHKNFDFLSKDRNLLNTQLNTGAGQVRQVSRLGYETVTNDFPNLIHGINELLLKAENNDEEVKIYFVGSVCGGTGSGCMLQISFFLQNYFYLNHGQRTYETTAFLLFPGVFTSVQDVQLAHSAKKRINANAYAFLKEWNTYNSIMQNNTDLPKYPELLELFLGETNGVQVKITTQDIENRAKYLQEPFKNIVCIDAAPGKYYKSLQNYKDIVSDYLYAVTTSDSAGEAPAKMVNNLGELMANQGINRFNSLNSVKVIYKQEEIEELASLVIFNRTFSEDYVRLDNEYETVVERLKEQRRLSDYRIDIPSRGEFFVKQFMEYANAVPRKFGGFYKESLNQLRVQYDREEGKETVNDVFKYELCFERILEHIKARSIQMVNTKGNPAISSFEKIITDELLRFEESDDKKDVVHSIETQINEFEIQINHISPESIDNIASGIINFKEKATDDAIDAARNSGYNPLFYILGNSIDRDNHSFFNPVTARFFLYKLNEFIKNEKKRLFVSQMGADGKYSSSGIISNIEDELNNIRKEDYLSKTEEIENPIDAINVSLERDEKWGILKSILGNNVKDFWENYKPNIELEKQKLIELYEYTLTYKVLEIISVKLEQFSVLWENYFINMNTDESKKMLNEKIVYLSKVLDNGREFEIFTSSEEKIRYVNSKFEKRDLVDSANRKAVRNLVNKTVDVIYELEQQGKSLNVENIKIGVEEVAETLKDEFAEKELFSKPLMDTWVDLLSSLGYNEEERNDRIKRDVNRLKNSGQPLISPIQNAHNDVTYPFWMLNEENEDFVSKRLPSIAGELGVKVSTNTTLNKDSWGSKAHRLSTNMIQKNELIYTSLNTNFSYKNIQAFNGPENPTLRSVFSANPNAGVYFKSYFTQRVAEWKTSAPSTHIDERWSGIGVLKDINENIDNLFVEEVNKAFIRGLSFGFFISTRNNLLQNTWKINTIKFPDVDLKNDFILDHRGENIRYGFSDLYFALYDNLDLVLSINGYIDEYGGRKEGIFNTIFKEDSQNKREWTNHRFVKGCLEEIEFIYNPNTKYNILDAITRFHSEGNNNAETYQLERSLLNTLFEELISYHKLVNGEGDEYKTKLRNLIKKMCKSSRVASNKNLYDCDLRSQYFNVIDGFYKNPNLQEYFKIC